MPNTCYMCDHRKIVFQNQHMNVPVNSSKRRMEADDKKSKKHCQKAKVDALQSFFSDVDPCENHATEA